MGKNRNKKKNQNKQKDENQDKNLSVQKQNEKICQPLKIEHNENNKSSDVNAVSQKKIDILGQNDDAPSLNQENHNTVDKNGQQQEEISMKKQKNIEQNIVQSNTQKEEQLPNNLPPVKFTQVEEKVNNQLAQVSLLNLIKIKQYQRDDNTVQNNKQQILQKYDEQVILIGATGAGKTTQTNFLLGNKIGPIQRQNPAKQERQKKSLIQAIIYSSGSESSESSELSELSDDDNNYNNDQNNTFLGVIDEKIKVGQIGHNHAESCTTQIQLYYEKEQKQILIDTAGFQDSRGSELEIINKIKLIQFIKQAKKLRIIIVIDYRSVVTHKGKLYKEVIDIINSLFDTSKIENFKEFYSKHCVFFITHCQQNLKEKDLKQAFKDLNEIFKKDENVQGLQLTSAIIDGFAIKNKSKQNKEEKQQFTFIARPQSDDLQIVWENIKKCQPIENPQQQIQLALSDDLQDKVDKYLYNSEHLLKKYIEQLNSIKEIEVIVDNLKYLQDLTKQKQINQMIEKLYQKVQNKTEQSEQQLIEYIKQQFVKHSQNLQTLSAKFLYSKDLYGINYQSLQYLFELFQNEAKQKIELLQQNINYSSEVSKLISKILPNDLNNHQNLPQKCLKSIISQFIHELLIEKSIFQFPEDPIQAIINYVFIQQNVFQLSKIIPKFKDQQDYVEQQIQGLLKSNQSNIDIYIMDIKNSFVLQQQNRVKNICENNKNLIKKISQQLNGFKNINFILEINNLESYIQINKKEHKQILDKIENLLKSLTRTIKSAKKNILQEDQMESQQSSINKLIILINLLLVFGDVFPNYQKEYKKQKEKCIKQLDKIHQTLCQVLQQNDIELQNNQQFYCSNIKSLQVFQDICLELFNLKYDYCHQIQEQIKNQIQLYSQSLQQQIDENKNHLYETDKLIQIYKHIVNLQWVDELYKVDYSKIAIQKVLSFALSQINLFQDQIDFVIQQTKIDLHKLADLYSKGIKYKKILEIYNQNKNPSSKINIIEDEINIISEQIQKMDNIFNQNMQYSQEQLAILRQVIDGNQQSNFNWETLIKGFEHLKLYVNLPIYQDQIKETVSEFDSHMSNVLTESQKFIQEIIYSDIPSFLQKIQQEDKIAVKISDSLKNIKCYQDIKEQQFKQQIFIFKGVNIKYISYSQYQEQFVNFFQQLTQFYQQEMDDIKNRDIMTNYNEIQRLYQVMQNLVQNFSNEINSLKPLFDQIESAKQLLGYKIKEIKNIFFQPNIQLIEQKVIENQDIIKSSDFQKENQYLQKVLNISFAQRASNLVDQIDNQSVKEENTLNQIIKSVKQLEGFQSIILKYFGKLELEHQIQKINFSIKNLLNKVKKHLNFLIQKREFDKIDEVLENYQEFIDKFFTYFKDDLNYIFCQKILDNYQNPKYIIDVCDQFANDCEQLQLSDNSKQTFTNLNRAVQMNRQKYGQIRSFFGKELKNKINQEIKELQQQQQLQQQHKKKNFYKIEQLKEKMQRFNEMYPEDLIDYDTECNQFKYDKNKIMRDINLLETLQNQDRINYIKNIQNTLANIMNDCDTQIPLYIEPFQLISQLIQKQNQQVKKQISYNQQCQDIKNIDYKDIIKNFDFLIDLEPLYEHSNIQKYQNEKEIQQILSNFYDNSNQLLNQQIQIIKYKLYNDNQQQKQQIKTISGNFLYKNSEKENVIDTEALIIWYQSVLIAERYQQKFSYKKYQQTAKNIINIQEIIQDFYDSIDKYFKNDTNKSFQLAIELKQLDKFIQFVKENQGICDIQQQQNSQQKQQYDNFLRNLKQFQEFCKQQQSSDQIIKIFNENIDNLSKDFWASFQNQNKQDLKTVSKIICNLQKSSEQKLKHVFQNIKQKLQNEFTQLSQYIVQKIDEYKFKEVQIKYQIINNTEEILYKNSFLDQKYSEDIINHFKQYLKSQQNTFEDLIKQVNDINKNEYPNLKIKDEIKDEAQKQDIINSQDNKIEEISDKQKIKLKKSHLKKIGKVLKYLQLITLNAPLLKQYVEELIIDLFEYVKKNNYHYLKEIKQELLNDGTVSDIDQNSEDDDSESSENEGLQFQQNLLNGQDENQIQNQEVNNDLMKQMGMQLFQYPIFNKLRIQDYQLKYNSKQPQDVIKDFKFLLNDQQQKIDENYLMENYDNLTKQFTRLREKYLNKDNIKNYREIAIEAQEIVKKIKDKKIDKKLGAINSELYINLLSKIFSIWSLQDITMDDIKNKEMTYQSPNVNQILSILIILNCHIKDGNFLIQIKNVFSSLFSNNNNNKKNIDNKIMNHVQQIKTGEGKSVIIGVLSVFFALLGFNVHSVCYSQYLSQRDEKAFQKLFENFKVQDKIFYGTFQQLCKRILEQNIKLQDATLDLVQFGNNKNFQQQQINQQFDNKVPKILICDEIDVFFSQDFYGKTYKQIAQLKTPEICQLIKYIWQQGKPRSNQQSIKWQDILNNVQQQDVYQKIIQQHNHVKDIIEQEIIKACFQVTNFKDHNNFFVENQKIGYKLSDHTKSYDITYEYLTQFAYLKANEDDDEEMAMQSVDQALSLNIVSGKISYAEVPLKYNLIFGVTGTLEELDNQMKKILKEKYEIKLKTLTPSIFNNSNLDFKYGNKDYFCIEPSQTELYNRIKALTHQKHQNKQAILIFFEDSKQLQAYYDSNYLAFPKEYYNVIDERTENKDDLIKLATLSKKITLLTKDYGRGTDFVCNSDEVKKNGGVVVIQTFFSNDPSEEAQIKGRTARQGEQGSYHIYLDQQVLYGQFDIDQQKVEQMINQGNAYEQLVQLRQQKLEREIKNLQNNLTTCNQKHEQTQKYISCLENKQNDAARAVLLQINEDTTIKSLKVQICPEQHIIFMLDSSGSMSGKPWQDLMSAFENCIQIKQQSNQNHIVSVIYYESRAHLICNQVKITDVIQIIRNTPQRSGGTNFSSAFTECSKLLLNENQQYQNYSKIIMFMTDGGAGDNFDAALQNLKQQFQNKIKRFQCQGFGQGANTQVLQQIANQFGQAGLFSQAIEKDQLQQQMIKFADIEVGYLG